MTTSVQRASHPRPVTVNLFCSQCDNQLGIFENEWTRLTTSYMRPALPGQHFASEIAQKTQVVPNGGAGQAAEGCTMAEVFCKKCSVAIAQYCKAAPRPEQANLVNQYFYKSSKTYLRTSDNKFQLEPVFGFSGDLGRISSRFNVPPRPKLPSVLRMSQTPLRNESTPSQLHPSSQPQLNSRESSLFHSRPYPEPEESLANKIAAQAKRLKYQEEKMAGHDKRKKEQDARIQALSDELDGFRDVLEDLRVTMGDLQAQATLRLPVGLDQNSLVSNLEHMITVTKNAFSMSSEIERLRTENEALKAKFDAIGASTAMPTAEAGGSNALGKRKRNGNISRPSHSQVNGIAMARTTTGYRDEALLKPILTPQSSIISAHSSQTSDRESIGAASQPGLTDTCPNGAVNNNDESDSVGVDSQVVSDTVSLSVDNNQVAADSARTAHSVQSTNTTSTSQIGYIEFSDDEPENRPPTQGEQPSLNERGTTTRMSSPDMGGVDANTQSSPQNSQDIDAARSEPETVFKRPRRTQRSTSRRVTDYELDHTTRSLAPEPVVRRRTLPRRLEAGGMDHVQIVTPTTVEEQMSGTKRPRLDRAVQSTEKLLNLELTELGLEEWIPCKDKSTNAEYKKAVETARVRQREKKKLETLASVGINLSPSSQQHVQTSDPLDSTTEQVVHNAPTSSGETPDRTNRTVTRAPSTVANKSTTGDTGMETPAAEDPGMMTRRKRKDEIRRRDQLAKEALEMDF